MLNKRLAVVLAAVAMLVVAAGIVQWAGSPPELYNSVRAPDLAGYWNVAWFYPSVGATARAL